MNSLSLLNHSGKKIDDWLSPILVKEVRQGMRARAFVMAFLLIQAFMILLVMGNVAAEDDRRVLESQNYYFWVIIGFALLFLMPLRGLGSISQEIRGNTLETIMLTRLTAWRVVFGKWSAIFAQSVLLTTAVLPYVVLRYFIGGNEVVTDLVWLGVMLWFSAILTAACIAISAMANILVRVLMLIAAVPTIITLIDSNIYGGGFSIREPWQAVAWLVVFGFFVPALLFELTASGIAPASENHAIRRRLLSLSLFLTCALLDWLMGSYQHVETITSLCVLIGVCYYDLSEKPRLLLRLVMPLRRTGPPGRLLGMFLLPGWPSALLFSLLVIPLSVALFFFEFSSVAKDLTNDSVLMPWLIVFALFGSVLIPITICHFLWRKNNQVFLMVVLFNAILFAVAALVEGFSSLMDLKIDAMLAFLPSVPVLMTYGTDPHKHLYSWHFIGNVLTLSALMPFLFVASRNYFIELSKMLKAKDVQAPTVEAAPTGATP